MNLSYHRQWQTLVLLGQQHPFARISEDQISIIYRNLSLLSGSSDLGLGNTTDLLGPVLLLLPLFAASPSFGFHKSLPQESVLGLELLGEVHCVVDKSEPSRLAATKLSLETECEATVD